MADSSRDASRFRMITTLEFADFWIYGGSRCEVFIAIILYSLYPPILTLGNIFLFSIKLLFWRNVHRNFELRFQRFWRLILVRITLLFISLSRHSEWLWSGGVWPAIDSARACAVPRVCDCSLAVVDRGERDYLRERKILGRVGFAGILGLFMV